MKIFILIIVALLLLITFIPLLFEINLELSFKEKNISLKIKYLFFSFSVNSGSKKEKKRKNGFNKKITVNHILDILANCIVYLSKKGTSIKSFSVDSKLGLGNAQLTGEAVGGLYSIIYNALALLHSCFKIEDCNVSVKPDFDNEIANVKLNCIFKFKNVHIITVLLFKIVFSILISKNRFTKESEQKG